MAGTANMGGGRLGYGNLENIGRTNTPASVGPVSLPADVDARMIAAGAGHTCVLDAEGDVWCWGDAVNGVLGTMSDVAIGDDEPASAATPVLLGDVAISISAGSQHTCALLEGGAVRCWGLADQGRLGLGMNLGAVGDDEPPSEYTVELGEPAVAVSAGRAHTCAILESGALRCWGHGGRGKLGLGDDATIGDNETPVDVDPVVVDTQAGVHVIAVDAGGDHTCAVLDSGGVRCWGRGDRGQLGYGSTDDVGVDEVPAAVDLVDFDGE
jgi:alpha-tubulin suppressor-like RCC1 family protein